MLRLLLAGHDAKSVARELGLSVHTVNDRLRDARRKLGVSSSREAARLLAETEQQTPNFLVPKKMGVSGVSSTAEVGESAAAGPNFFADKKMGLAEAAGLADGVRTVRRGETGGALIWLGGGLIVVLTIIVAFMPPIAWQNGDEAPEPAAPVAAQQAMDVMPIADANGDGSVTVDEYETFSQQGWNVVSQGKDQVQWAELDGMARVSFLGIAPNGDGVITRQMYIDAIPGRFTMFDRNGDGTLSSDEINGRAFQR